MKSESQSYASYSRNLNQDPQQQSYHSATFQTLQTSQRNYVLEQTQNIKDEEKRLLQKRIEDLEFQLKNLSQKPIIYEQEIARSTIQREALQTDFGSANQTIRQLQSKISDLEVSSQIRLSQQNEASKRQILDLEDRLQKLQIQCDSQVIQINQLQRDKVSLASQCQALQDQIGSSKLNYKQEISEGELRYSKESQRLSLVVNEKQVNIQQWEQRYQQLSDQFQILQRKYDQDTSSLKVQCNDAEDRYRRLQQQFDQQTILVNTINMEKQNLSVQLDKLQSESNTKIYNYQSTIKTSESQIIRDQQQFQAQLNEKIQQINDLEKKNRQQLDQYFSLQQQYDKDTQALNYRVQDLEDKLTKLSRSFDQQTNELNQIYSDKERAERQYLKLQDEINTQKLRYNQEISKTDELSSKERSWFQVQLNDRQQTITELELKVKQLSDQLQTIQRRTDNEVLVFQKQITELTDRLRSQQEQLDLRNNQYNQLNKEKSLVINQFEQLQQEFNDYKRIYENDVSKLNRDNQRITSNVNEKTQSYIQLEGRYQLLNEEFQALQVRFEKETNNYTMRMKELEEDLSIMIENYRREQSINRDWEQQVIRLKQQIKYSVDETRITTEKTLIEKYENLTSEQKQEFDIIFSKLNQDKNELRIQLNQKADQIRALENQVTQLSLQSTKNQTLIAELESANQSLKYQVNEQEQKIKTLIMQEFDSLRDKSADQTIRNLMAEIKALQNKLKKYEVYMKNIDDQKLQEQLQNESNLGRSSYVIEQRVTTGSVINQGSTSQLNNGKVQQLESSLMISQQRERELQNQISQLSSQLNQQGTNSQRNSQFNNQNNDNGLNQLNEKIRSQEREIVDLRSKIQSISQTRADTRQQYSQQEDKDRRIIELENKCALLANENSRLNLMRSKAQSGQQNQPYVSQSNNGSQRYY
ncbi:unnamed protein product (macronuclear) [Paramecium tetraurelia]|uniref:Uncharacterized protein n=1 Tax=Paramecium tetraurelia TaxID=5888 RepID=A0BRK7_PARTE|nr:uncharacterized protein GSPATT00031405001 [Paramecium tetraurelia]CAK61174.1 unnamed protein product [Paramecium tetraurelia]|eukprot:XP_001428572.1 hypothetical protein (macronuclear) [Paramecium tetraurelia strain d4-2]